MNAHELHVWTACPQQFDAAHIASLVPLLDDEERERCARFRFAQDRRAYIVSHAMRRAALARVLGASPSAIRIQHDTHGKPELCAASPAGRIFFSHSRRREAVAVAVTRLGPVGIDVESASAPADGQELLESHVREADPENFPGYWTAVEAFWKAEGTGLDDDHRRIECSPDSSRPFPIRFEGNAGPRALARALPPVAGCVTTVAVLGSQEFDLRHHHCNSVLDI